MCRINVFVFSQGLPETSVSLLLFLSKYSVSFVPLFAVVFHNHFCTAFIFVVILCCVVICRANLTGSQHLKPHPFSASH